MHIQGFRAPWLHRTKDLISILDKNKFIWDSSFPDSNPTMMGYAGSGCSTVYPFHPLIKEDDKYVHSSIVELPVTIPQDWMCIHPLGMSPKELYDLWKKKVDYIQSLGGLALFITHPARYDLGDKRYLPVYEKIIKYVLEKKPYISTCTEICETFIKNE